MLKEVPGRTSCGRAHSYQPRSGLAGAGGGGGGGGGTGHEAVAWTTEPSGQVCIAGAGGGGGGAAGGGGGGAEARDMWNRIPAV